MNINRSQFVSRSLFSILLLFSSAVLAEDAAEFALRWDPTAGGPKTAIEVISQLQLPSSDDVKEYKVSYFSVASPSDLPAGYSVIARQRSKGKKTELTIKYRGDTPLPETFDIETWNCPLGVDAEKKYEVDISLLPDAEVKKAYSVSCSIETKKNIAFPSELNATQIGCESRMHRYKTSDLKIEEWTFQPGAQKLIEVSKNGQDNANDFETFKTEVATPLIDSGIRPIVGSKSASAATCTE